MRGDAGLSCRFCRSLNDRAIADAIGRERFGNSAVVLSQIGIEIQPCPGRCGFCSLGENHTRLTPGAMAPDEILAIAGSLTASGPVYAVFLMTTHRFDFRQLVRTVERLRDKLPRGPRIVVNTGDFNLDQARALKEAGVSGAYHILRLREGKDTELSVEQRLATIKAVRDAGLDLYYCCEPIGPEHTPEEIVDQLFVGLDYGCVQHGAMRRVQVPDSPLAALGQITELRLAQVTAVVALASLACREIRSIGVHEPNPVGLTSGANAAFAETGANPRDTERDTTGNRGLGVDACVMMLREAGFERLMAPNSGIACPST